MATNLVAVLDKLGHYTQQPQTWAGIAAALALAGGGRGRRAALRGSVCYGAAAILTNFVLKPLVKRRRPAGAGEGELGPVTSSFPSGHAVADLAFSIGAAQEMPALFVPLSAATFPAHWSLVRSNGHHLSDVLLGGVVGLIVPWGVGKLWPVAEEKGQEEKVQDEKAQEEEEDRSEPSHTGRAEHEKVAVRRAGESSLGRRGEARRRRTRRLGGPVRVLGLVPGLSGGGRRAKRSLGGENSMRYGQDRKGTSGAARGGEEERSRQELRSLWTEVDGRRYHARVPVEQAPEGPDVVLVHGYGVSSRNMVPTAEALAAHCRVYAPDLPGHGLSYKPQVTLDLPGLAEALAEWMTAIGLQRACLLGNSYGSQICVELAVRYPDRVERLILQAPTVDPKARTLPRQLARRVASGWRERNESEPADNETTQDWWEIGLRRMVKDARHALRDPIEEKLPRLQVPTLVVRGSRDPIVPQRWAEEATDLIPRGRLVVLPEAIHTITFTRPDQLVEAILPFLKEAADEESKPQDAEA